MENGLKSENNKLLSENVTLKEEIEENEKRRTKNAEMMKRCRTCIETLRGQSETLSVALKEEIEENKKNKAKEKELMMEIERLRMDLMNTKQKLQKELMNKENNLNHD